MIGSLSSALSGLMANQRRVEVAGTNIANADTRAYRRQVLTLEEGPAGGVVSRVEQNPASMLTAGEGTVDGNPFPSDVELTEELPSLNLAKSLYKANLEVVRTQDEMLGILLDRRD